MPAAIVFDLFHTLVAPEDFRPREFSRVGQIAALLGLDPGALAAHFDETFVERETTPILQVDVVGRFARARGRALTADERAEIDDIMGRHDDMTLRSPRDEVLRLVRDLAEAAPLALLSNCHEREVRSWPDSPLAPFFAAVGFSCEIGALKPDPVTYTTVLEGLGVPAVAAAFVGNGGSDELAGARRAGFGRVVHCNVFDRHLWWVPAQEQARRASQADASVDTIEEMAEELAAWATS